MSATELEGDIFRLDQRLDGFAARLSDTRQSADRAADQVGELHADLVELRDRLDRAIADSLRLPALDEARAACNEAGIHVARRQMHEAIVDLDTAQTDKRAADLALTEAIQQEAEHRAEVEWELDGRFTVEGNKTFLVAEDGTRKQMTADERRAWKTFEADRHPAVHAAKQARYAAEQQALEARDRAVLAERRFAACKHDLDAAVAVLQTLRTALTSGDAR